MQEIKEEKEREAQENQEEKERLEELLARVKVDLEENKLKNKNLTDLKHVVEPRVKELSSRIEKTEEENLESHSRNRELQGQLGVQLRENESLKRRLQAMEEESTRDLERLQKERNNMVIEIGGIKRTMESREKEIKKNNETINDIRRHETNLRKELSLEKEKTMKNDQEVHILSNKIKDFTMVESDYNERIFQLQKKMELMQVEQNNRLEAMKANMGVGTLEEERRLIKKMEEERVYYESRIKELEDETSKMRTIVLNLHPDVDAVGVSKLKRVDHSIIPGNVNMVDQTSYLRNTQSIHPTQYNGSGNYHTYQN